MGWLDQFFHGYEAILNAGALLRARAKINFAAPLVATDDPANGWSSIAVSPATASSSGTLAAADFAKLQSPSCVTQPSIAARGNGGIAIAFAPLNAARTISRVDFIPIEGGLTANDTNFVVATLSTDATGTATFTPIASRSSNTAAAGGTGNWVAGMIAFSFTTPVIIPAGQALVIQWSQIGTGAAIPYGSYSVA